MFNAKCVIVMNAHRTLEIRAVAAAKPFLDSLAAASIVRHSSCLCCAHHRTLLQSTAPACIHLLHCTPTKPHSTVVLFAINKFIISFLLSAHSFLSLCTLFALHTISFIARLSQSIRWLARFVPFWSRKNVRYTYMYRRARSRVHTSGSCIRNNKYCMCLNRRKCELVRCFVAHNINNSTTIIQLINHKIIIMVNNARCAV